MKNFKRISLFFMFLCISQLVCVQTIQASNKSRQGATQIRNKTGYNQQSRSSKKAGATRYRKNKNSKVNNPAAAGAAGTTYQNNQQQQQRAAGAAVHNNNQNDQQQQQNLQALAALCMSNPTDQQCLNQTSSTTTA